MDMDLKLFGSGMDVKPGTPPISARSTTPTSSPYRYHPGIYRQTHTHMAAMAQEVEWASSNRRIDCSVHVPYSQRVKVSVGNILNPKL